MAFINFGYAISAARAASSAYQARDTGPSFPDVNLLNFNIGDSTNSQINTITLLGGDFDFLWGCHPWGSSKYKVTK